jgi:hypothetical protein
MKKLFILLVSITFLTGCAESIALLGPATGVTNGKVVQSSLKSAINYGIKKTTGSSPMEHALVYAKKMNPNNNKERCISFIEKTNSKACMIAKKQISLVKSTVEKKILTTQSNLKVKAHSIVEKSVEVKSRINNSNNTKKSTKEFFLTLKTKIKEYDERWLDRIEKSSLHQ